MNTSKSFRDLVTSLPVGGFAGASTDAFAIAGPVEDFIAPTFRVQDQPADAAVTLISARGATGKSMLARRLSHQKQVPLWRLHRDRTVSADALAARLGQYLGGARDPVDRFTRNDDTFLIIDALDEARMRVSGVSWDEFLESLVAVTGNGHQRFVMLGRERVLEDVWLHLADAGVAANWYEISHFSGEQRLQYVDMRVSRLGGDAHGTAYEEARDAVLAALAGTVDSELAEAFVGYAPVLDAVVALLSQGNLRQVYNDFADPGRADDRIHVLLGILQSLLEREREKTGRMADELGLDRATAYAPDEQLQWLASEIMGGTEPDLAWCPADKRSDYVSQVRIFLRDHPFRTEEAWASPVFSAYVTASRFGDRHIRGGLTGVGSQTGLLFEFASAIGAADVIDEWQFAALHASVLAAEWEAVEAVVSIDTPPAAQSLEATRGELVLIEESEARRTEFELVLDNPGELQLMGPTSFLSATFSGTVTVSSGSGSLTLGPDCLISGARLRLYGDSVEVLRRKHGREDPGASEPSVVLEAGEEFTAEGSLAGTPPREALEIRLPATLPLTFPWVNYRADLFPADEAPSERAVRFLNMFMRLVRRHGHSGRPAVYDKKLEGRQSIKEGQFTNAVAALQAQGVVSREGSLIFLQPEWEEHRFSATPRDGLLTLDDKIDQWRPALDAIAGVLNE